VPSLAIAARCWQSLYFPLNRQEPKSRQTLNWANRAREYTDPLDEPVKHDGRLPDKLVLNDVKPIDPPLSTSAPENEKGQQAPQIWTNRTGVVHQKIRLAESPIIRLMRPGDRHGSRSSSRPLQGVEPEGPHRFPCPSDCLT
jgi:hypothetical protein